mgnify:CR=1 FL=1
MVPHGKRIAIKKKEAERLKGEDDLDFCHGEQIDKAAEVCPACGRELERQR